jgi:predicted flavoprotein YhiN
MSRSTIEMCRTHGIHCTKGTELCPVCLAEKTAQNLVRAVRLHCDMEAARIQARGTVQQVRQAQRTSVDLPTPQLRPKQALVLPEALGEPMTRQGCTLHGVVTLNKNGCCPKCYCEFVSLQAQYQHPAAVSRKAA